MLRRVPKRAPKEGARQPWGLTMSAAAVCAHGCDPALWGALGGGREGHKARAHLLELVGHFEARAERPLLAAENTYSTIACYRQQSLQCRHLANISNRLVAIDRNSPRER